jgi:hypothetical protein
VARSFYDANLGVDYSMTGELSTISKGGAGLGQIAGYGLSGVGYGLQIYGGIKSPQASLGAARAYDLQAEYEEVKGQFDYITSQQQARITDIQAEDVEEKGRKTAGSLYVRERKYLGAARAAAQAQGVATDSGSVAVVRDESKAAFERDILQVKANAFAEAWGYRFQAGETRFKGIQSQGQAKLAAIGLREKAAAERARGWGGFLSTIGTAVGGTGGFIVGGPAGAIAGAAAGGALGSAAGEL